MECGAIEPRVAAERREIYLVDVREADERTTIGYVPGSILIPEATILRGGGAALGQIPRGAHIVLICQSGRRSCDLAPTLVRYGYQVPSLQGGVLGWGEAGYPVCGLALPPELPFTVATVDEFPLALRSCFVAESIENALNHGADALSNPVDTLEQVYARLGVSWDHPTVPQLYRVLDHLAAIARQQGHPLDRIAANVDWMAELLHRIERTSLGT